MSFLPDLSALDDLPEKTEQMLDTLDRLEKLLRCLIDVQVGAHSQSLADAEEVLAEVGTRHGIDL